MNKNIQEQKEAPAVDQKVSVEEKKGKVSFLKKLNPKKLTKSLAILAIALFLLGGISVLAYKNISLFVVGRVEKTFITRKQLNDKLIQVYGASMLEELMNEQIISQGIAKSDVKYTQEELDAKIATVEGQVQENMGMSLDAYLETQKLSRKDFEKNMIMQLSLEKILTPSLKVTDEKIDAFMKTNEGYLTGETEEAKRAEAVEALLDQELGTAFQAWLEKRTAETKISTFLD